MNKSNSLLKQLKYDFLIFLREPFFALPIMILPAFFFAVYAGIYTKQGVDLVEFGKYIPMYMLIISFSTVFFNIGIQIVTDKETGVLKRITISPMNIYKIVLTYIIRGMVISILGFFEIIAVSKYIYKIPLSGNVNILLFSFILMVGILLLLSLAIHGFFKNSRQVVPFTILAFQYVLFCSGMMFPIDSLPNVFKNLVYINPVYHMNKILTNIWYGDIVSMNSILPLIFTCILCILLLRVQKGLSFDNR